MADVSAGLKTPRQFAHVDRKARSECRARDCLSCHQTFPSEGIHNRMCDSCKNLGYAPNWGEGPSRPRQSGKRKKKAAGDER